MANTNIYTKLSTTDKMTFIAEWVLEKKGKDFVAFDLSKENNVAEAVCIVTATSARHAQGLAEYIFRQCKTHKFERLNSEGESTGQWILLDLNDIIVHIMQEESRNMFKLQELWPAAPIISDHRGKEENGL